MIVCDFTNILMIYLLLHANISNVYLENEWQMERSAKAFTMPRLQPKSCCRLQVYATVENSIFCVIYLMLPKRHSYEKHTRLSVNFINILRTNFSYERHFSSYVLALLKNLYKKCARIMLMKLTTAVFDYYANWLVKLNLELGPCLGLK